MSVDSSPMVVSRLIGGLGNQMFQYAVGRAISARHDIPLLLDITGFNEYSLRRYELDAFTICADIATDAQLATFALLPRKQVLWSALRKYLLATQSQSVFREASYRYDDRIEALIPPVLLDGYWQSEKYFAHLGPVLRREFTLKGGIDSANGAMLSQILGAEARAVSLHVRRGDYVSNPETAKYHGVCTLDYYRLAIEQMSLRISSPHFFIFSDDPDWVQDSLSIPHATTLVQINDADHGMFDLELMKSCDHHIIANSSFSWWGAWLNPSTDKIVIAPKQWFRESANDTRDLLPSAWIRL